MRLGAAAVLAGFLVAVAPSAVAQEKRVALIVGNDAYRTLPKLNNAANDARAIETRLKALGWETVVRINASKRDMNRALDEFGNKLQGVDGAGLFYYAGHGIQAGGRNFLIPVDAELETEVDLRTDAIDAALVTLAMDDQRNRVNIIMLDACRDNPLPARGRSATRGLAVAEKSPSGPRGSVVVYAAAPNQQAQDGTVGSNGIFTGAFVKALSGPNLKIEDVFKAVSADVKSATGGKQVPWITSSLQGDFYFGTPAAPPAPPPAAAAPAPTDAGSAQVAFWNSIASSDDPRMFEEYLRQYPQGRFVGLAKLKIESLSKKPAAPAQVAALTPPTAKAPEIDPIDREYIALGASRVRENPDLSSKQLAALKDGEKVQVLGRVKGQDWLMVELASGQGYVPRAALEDAQAYQARKQKEADAAAERKRAEEQKKLADLAAQEQARKTAAERAVIEEQVKREAASRAAAEAEARRKAEEARLAEEARKAEEAARREAARVAAEEQARRDAVAPAATQVQEKRLLEERQRMAAVTVPPPVQQRTFWEGTNMRVTAADPGARNCGAIVVTLAIDGNHVEGAAQTGFGTQSFQGTFTPSGEIRTSYRLPGAGQSVVMGTLQNLTFTGRNCIGVFTMKQKAAPQG